MREILFRGKAKAGYKRIAEGEWIEGSLFYSDNENRTVYQIATSYLSASKDGPVMVVAYKVDSSTVCQYTGLNDKNSRKIFEGDIIKWVGAIGKVKWYHGNYTGWYVDEIYMGEQQFTNEMWNECESIGNIFDNPELIEK